MEEEGEHSTSLQRQISQRETGMSQGKLLVERLWCFMGDTSLVYTHQAEHGREPAACGDRTRSSSSSLWVVTKIWKRANMFYPEEADQVTFCRITGRLIMEKICDWHEVEA